MSNEPNMNMLPNDEASLEKWQRNSILIIRMEG